MFNARVVSREMIEGDESPGLEKRCYTSNIWAHVYGMYGARIAQLVEQPAEKPGVMLMWVLVPGTAFFFLAF